MHYFLHCHRVLSYTIHTWSMRRAILASFVSSSAALLHAYDAALLVRPRVVKAATGGSLAFLGDLNAQRLEVWSRNQQRRRRGSSELENFRFDGRRSLAFTTMAAGWTGPVNHAWYNLLERLMPQAGGGLLVVAAKVGASQLIANPFFYLPTFYLWTGAVLGRSLSETHDKARREAWSVLKATWVVLGTANVLMFSVIPVSYQATFMALTSFVYQNMLSLLANRDRAKQRQRQD